MLKHALIVFFRCQPRVRLVAVILQRAADNAAEHIAGYIKLGEAERQAEAAKTTRLRALRLAKEAADREVASRKTAASAGQRRRGRAP